MLLSKYFGNTRAYRSSQYSPLLIVPAAGLILLSAANFADAKPDKCTTKTNSQAQTVQSCTGNQSAGIRSGTDFATSSLLADVGSLTSLIGPAQSAVGIYHVISGQGTKNAEFNFLQNPNPWGTISTTTAHGALITSQGGKGGDGSNGGAGSSGGSIGPITLRTAGSISVDGNPSTSAIHGEIITITGGGGGKGSSNIFYSGGNGGGGGTTNGAYIGGNGQIWTHWGSGGGGQGSAVSIIQKGGNGGGGGENYAYSGATGGKGGAVNGFLTVTPDRGDWTLISGNLNSGHGLHIQQSGGAGGTGGNGTKQGAAGAGADGGFAQIGGNPFNWTINTYGMNSHGIFFEGAGGNGGTGGLGAAGDGGKGGAGGTGAAAYFLVAKQVTIGTGATSTLSTGDGSSGILAVSQGGRGGNGGTSNTNTGGTAGTGGTGGILSVESASGVSLTIATQGKNAHGAVFAALGGNGGNGGPGKVFGSGSNGGQAGTGGTVDLSGLWVINTKGDSSNALAATSAGGTGGQGADGSFFGSGGNGGGSGPGGSVTLNVAGNLDTQGAELIGIMAQSLAGRGGSGGTTSNNYVSFNASGGSAGNGGLVDVANNAGVVTTGNQSVAIVAQSIGGGGGHGGQNFGIFYSKGGSGSIGGAGGTVNVTNNGHVSTYGNDAHGIQAQSIGGTGGDGGAGASLMVALGGNGSATSPGGTVTVTNTATIETGLNPSSKQGADQTCGTGCSHGIMAQSIGGGGGNGGSATGWFTVGANGGGGGDGGAVKVINSAVESGTHALINTKLEASSAIYAQSVGGGGGYGGGGISVGAGVAVAVGGSGAKGGNGNKVDVVASRGGTLSTIGEKSHGIFAQSVGGGGGVGGFGVSISASAYPSAAVSVGGTGGLGGNSGAVTVTTVDTSYTESKANEITTKGTESRGIFAQSVGGGGGDGGFAIAVTGGGSFASGAFSVGGSGGAGGNSAAVYVTSDALITTSGEKAQGILGQSVGGGGGNGAMSIAGAVNLGGAGIAVSVGGSGASAGSGSFVNIANNTKIVTSGAHADGILAQSVGGGGGNGGLSIAGSVAIGGPGIAVSLGGTGSGGGAGSDVYVANSSNSNIITSGDDANAVIAQSLGGGGGNGGLSVAGTITGGNSGALSLSIGRAGGGGGNAASAGIANDGAIVTTGSRAIGLFAQSVGGGGGAGGISIAGTLSGPDAKSVSVAVGGSGGSGGTAAAVNVINTGAITTGSTDDQDNAHGIFAQSVGGGGGNGGFSGAMTLGAGGESTTLNVAISVGGSGGSTGVGGTVVAEHDGGSNGITTLSPQSHAIFAQSVGGTGGNGGSGFAASVEALAAGNSSTLNVVMGVGGKGGNGSSGGSVEALNSSGSLETWGAASHGIYAHSIGGSGGSGGSMWTLAYNMKCGVNCDTSGGSNYNVDIGIGGKGGTGSHGGDVFAINYGSIHTHGDSSIGVYAYSIGGGGGDGGDAAGIPDVPPLTDRVSTFKDLTINVGGTGGTSGNGGEVTALLWAGGIITEGLNSPGIYAQSVGGGGGRGGTGTVGATGKVAIGGGGGAAGDGGTISVYTDNSASIVTTSGINKTGTGSQDIDGSYGIFAQSVGGGGGQAGNAVLFGDHGYGVTDVSIGIGFTLALPGGNAGNGGFVGVNSNASTTTTYGSNGIGIFAQSVGGGGGVAGNVGIGVGTAVSTALVGSVGGDGIGGPVSVTSNGNVITFGDGATGIFAQSAGGTAALTSAGADVTVEVNSGSVAVSGTDASGILVQSVRVSNGNPVGAGSSHVTVAAGASVQGGFGGSVQSGAGVEFLDGVANTLINNGAITSLGGTAVVHQGTGTLSQSGNGTLSVTNAGLIVGDFNMAAGNSRVHNLQGGRIYLGTSSRIGGSKGEFLNNGRLIVYREGDVGTTALNTNLIQGPSGTLAFDLNHVSGPVKGVHADLLTIGGSADLDGTVIVHVRDPGAAGIGRQSITLVEATGGLSAGRLTVGPSAVAQYRLDRQADHIDLSYDVDFANASATRELSSNQTQIASHVAALHGAGGVGSGLLFLAEAADAAAYGQSLDGLSPAPYGVSASASLMSGMQFADSLMSCKERSGANRFIREADCLRLDGGARRYSQDATGNSGGFDLSWGGIGIGGQTEVSEGWIVGAGLGYDFVDGASDGDLWRSDGSQFQAGAVVKRQIGPALFAVSLGGGIGSADIDRNVSPGVTAKGEQDFWFASSQLRAAYAFEFTDWYLKPIADLNLSFVDTGSVTETGAGAANLRVNGSEDFYAAFRPAIEAGLEVVAAGGATFRPHASIGITQFLTDPSQSVTAHLSGAGLPFTVTNDMDRTFLDLELGLDLFTAYSVRASVNALAQFSENATNLSGSARLAIAF